MKIAPNANNHADVMAGDVVVEPALAGKGGVVDGTDASSTREADLDRIYARTSRHVIPLFICVAIVNHIDRTNVAFASLTMNADLGFNAAVYGLGSSLFFVGFFICQVSSRIRLPGVSNHAGIPSICRRLAHAARSSSIPSDNQFPHGNVPRCTGPE